MRPAELERLFRELHTAAPDRLDERIYQTIDRAAGRVSPWRSIMRHPLTKLAVVAVVLIGIFYLTRAMIGKEAVPTRSDQEIATETAPERPAMTEDVGLAELARARSLFEAGDVGGLLTLLEEGRDETKIAVARYLEQIGDERAIPPLENLAEAWRGSAAENPFRRALDLIEARQRLNVHDPNNQTRLAPLRQPEWAFQAQGVLSGVVSDALTGAPILGVQVELPSYPPSYARSVTTDKYGFYSIEDVVQSGNWQTRVKSKTHLGESLVVKLSRSEKTVKHFQLEPGCGVELEVVDEEGVAIEGAEVAASWLGEDYQKMDQAKDRTDPNGHVLIGALEPSETPYRLIALHSDFAPSQVTLKLSDTGAAERVRLELSRGTAINGFVEYADGVPAVGIGMSVRPDWWHTNRSAETATADEGGLFTLHHVLPGTYGLRAHLPEGKGTVVTPVGLAELPLPEGDLLTIRLPRRSPSSARGMVRGNDTPPRVREREDLPETARIMGTVVSALTGERVRRFEARTVKFETLRGPNYTPEKKWRAFEEGAFDLEAKGPGVYRVEVRA